MNDYCIKYGLKVNATKTKAVVFSKGKIRKLPEVFYNGVKIEVVHQFQYLGITINYNGSFKPAQQVLYNRASKAMFSLIRKMKKLLLPIDIQIELFDKTIVPILLYGSEAWCPQMCEQATKLQQRFYKIVLTLGKSTPAHMLFGELGKFPLELQAKQRMLNFWYKLIDSQNKNKLSSVMYKFLLQLKARSYHNSSFIETVQQQLNRLGLSNVWLNQLYPNSLPSASAFKAMVKQRLQDQYIQEWTSNNNNNQLYYNYRLFKTDFVFENYLKILPFNLASNLVKFRTLNNRMPVQKGRYLGISRPDRLCLKCNCSDLGDEFHYLFVCSFFREDRIKLIRPYFRKNPNVIKFHDLLANTNKTVLLRLVRFINIILKNM